MEQQGEEYGGGGDDVESGVHVVENNLCGDALFHGDFVMTLHMVSAEGNRKVTLALQEDQSPLQH